MKKRSFNKLLSSIDEARILKARERVLKAAKRWRKTMVGMTYYVEQDRELDLVVKAIDKLNHLESPQRKAGVK